MVKPKSFVYLSVDSVEAGDGLPHLPQVSEVQMQFLLLPGAGINGYLGHQTGREHAWQPLFFNLGLDVLTQALQELEFMVYPGYADVPKDFLAVFATDTPGPDQLRRPVFSAGVDFDSNKHGLNIGRLASLSIPILRSTENSFTYKQILWHAHRPPPASRNFNALQINELRSSMPLGC